MAEKKDKKKKKWKGLKGIGNLLWKGDYESSNKDTEYVQSAQGVQTTEIRGGAGTYIDPVTGQIKKTEDYAAWLASLPEMVPLDRITQYELIEKVIDEDDYQKAITYIMIRACSKSQDTGKKIHIDPDNDADDKNEHFIEAKQVVANLDLDSYINDWILKASVFGIKAIRPLKEQGVGITGIYDDERLHPKYIQGYKWFDPEANKTKIGYVFPMYQKAESAKGMKVFQKDDIVIFKRKKTVLKSDKVQNLLQDKNERQKELFDLWEPKTWEGKQLLNDYGHSIVLSAYKAWLSLQNIRLSVEKARLRSAKSFALVSVPTDGLSPEKAQEHSDGYGKIINQIYNKTMTKLSSLMSVVTVPYNALKQKIDVLFNEVSPNITGLADMEKAESRFASAMGLDTSVVAGDAGGQAGFGGAGLMDATTAESAQMSKDSNAAGVDGVEELLRIHFLLKDGLVFTSDNKPYKVRIHTGDTRAEKERLALEEQRQMQVNQQIQRDVMLADFVDINFPESIANANEKYLKIPKEETYKIYTKKPPPPPEPEGGF